MESGTITSGAPFDEQQTTGPGLVADQNLQDATTNDLLQEKKADESDASNNDDFATASENQELVGSKEAVDELQKAPQSEQEVLPTTALPSEQEALPNAVEA